MLTFLEFYQTFLSFINYRLYTSINLVYPPKLDIDKDDAGAGLAAYLLQSNIEKPTLEPERAANTLPVKDTSKQLETLPSKIASLATVAPAEVNETSKPDEDTLDIFIPQQAEEGEEEEEPIEIFPQTLSLSADSENSLFQGLHVFLSRETPVDALTFTLLSFGVSSLSTDPTSGPSPYPESHTIITHQVCDRNKLPDSIVPGRKYVQPQWVVDSINGGILLDESLYVPGAELPAHLSPFVTRQEAKYDPEAPVEGEESEEEEEIDETAEHQRLVVAEAAGQAVVEEPKKSKKRKIADEDKEAKDMARIMMSNKNRRLLDAMEYGNKKKREEKDKLQKRKRELVKDHKRQKKAKLG
jgi:pescadillo